MADCMTFPKTADEFIEQYSFKDEKQEYTNGAELIPVFRVKQMMEHFFPEEVVRCKECKSWEQYNSCDGTNPHRCMNYDAMFYRRTNPDDFCSYGERKDNGS